MRFLRGFGRFWYDFLVGDDWKIAAVVIVVVAVAALLLASGVTGSAFAPLFAAAVVIGFVVVMFINVAKD